MVLLWVKPVLAVSPGVARARIRSTRNACRARTLDAREFAHASAKSIQVVYVCVWGSARVISERADMHLALTARPSLSLMSARLPHSLSLSRS